MKTDTWIERVIIQQLSYPDKRYKHDYKSKEAPTIELAADCAYLEDVSERESTTRTWENINELHDQMEGKVEQAIETLREQGLLTKIGDQPIGREPLLMEPMEQPNSESEPAETTPIWTLTEEGMAEAARISDAYAEDLARLAAQYESPEDVPHDELLPMLKQYGVVPDGLPRD